MFCHCFSFIFVCYCIKCFNIYVFCFFWSTYFCRYSSFKTFQLPVHLFKVIMNEYYLSSLGFISIVLGLTMHGSSSKNRHFVANYLLKLNNTIKRLNLILHYSLPVNICEYLICQVYQQNCNRLKNHKHFHLKKRKY